MKSSKLFQPVRGSSSANYNTPSKPNQLYSPQALKNPNHLDLQGNSEVNNDLTPEKQELLKNDNRIIKLLPSQRIETTSSCYDNTKNMNTRKSYQVYSYNPDEDQAFEHLAQQEMKQNTDESEMKVSDYNVRLSLDQFSGKGSINDNLQHQLKTDNMKKVGGRGGVSKQNSRTGQDGHSKGIKIEDQSKVHSTFASKKNSQNTKETNLGKKRCAMSQHQDSSMKDILSTQDDQDKNILQNKNTILSTNAYTTNEDMMNTMNSQGGPTHQTQFSPLISNRKVSDQRQDLQPPSSRAANAQQEQPTTHDNLKPSKSAASRPSNKRSILGSAKSSIKPSNPPEKRPSAHSNIKSRVLKVEDTEKVPEPRTLQEIQMEEKPKVDQSQSIRIDEGENKNPQAQDYNKLNLYYPNLLNTSRDRERSGELNRSRRSNSMNHSQLDMTHQERQSKSPDKKKYMEPTEAYLSKFRKDLGDEELDDTNEFTFSPQKKSVYFINHKIKPNKFESVLKTQKDIKSAQIQRMQQMEAARRQKEWEEQERQRLEQEEIERQQREEEMREMEALERQMMEEEEEYSRLSMVIWKKQDLEAKRRRQAEERLRREQEELRRQKTISDKLVKMRQQQREKNREMSENDSPCQKTFRDRNSTERSVSSRASGTRRMRELNSPSLWKLNKGSIHSEEPYESFPSPKSRREQFMNKKESQDQMRQGGRQMSKSKKRILNQGLGSRSNSKGMNIHRKPSPTRGEIEIANARKKNSMSKVKLSVRGKGGKIDFRRPRARIDLTSPERIKSLGRNQSQADFKSKYAWPQNRNFNLDEIEQEIVDRLYITPRSGRTHSHSGGWLSCLTCTLQNKYKSNGQEQDSEQADDQE